MFSPFQKIRLLAGCVVFSILMHFLLLYASRMFGTYDFGAPVNLPRGVAVELADQMVPAPAQQRQQEPAAEASPPEDKAVDKHPATIQENTPSGAQMDPGTKLAEPAAGNADSDDDTASRDTKITGAGPIDASHQAEMGPPSLPRLRTGNFLAAQHEKLTYQITMFGIPVGSAELESKNENGEVWITLRVRSNAAFSNIFLVDNVVETRHISGRFIMTNIRQREGSFRSEQMFTINLEKKRVSFVDLIKGTNLQMTYPTGDILDTLSGIYYLRNRQLLIGSTETLHIYDSETYADVPVEIIRKEFVYLPNLTKVDTLVVRPLQKTAGIFRRTGDILIWMSNDDGKVPVKIVTSIAQGTVTAVLVSSETTPYEETAVTLP